MVVQKNWNTDEGSQQSSSSEEQEGASWSIQVPARAATARAVQPCNVQTRQPITRQIAINTLAAMHRRYSLPGPVQPYSRPIAEFRASANKSLDMLRQTLQSAVTKEIDQVIKKYLEKFFVPAVNNIRLNLGVESVSEDQVRAVCRAMLDATRLLYTTPRPGVSTGENNDSESSSSVDSKFPRQIMPSSFTKRKESDTESDGSVKRRKIKVEDGRASPLPSGMLRDPEKWNPARLNQDTLFIMGSHAHKVLGMGNSRGRLYTKHASLPRYPADTTDKEWIASHNLVNAVGGKTYIMVLEDIEELATSEAYRHTSLPMLGELSGFKVPQFMLIKIRSYVMRRVLSGEVNNPDSPQPSTSSSDEFDKFKVDFLKVEQEEDNYDDTMNANQVISSMGAKKDYIEVELVKDDFPDIKVDDNKVEDIDDIKVENMKVEDLDEIKVDDIKVEDFDDDVIKADNYDINVDNIKDEDIKLEHDDTLSVCQQAGDEPDQLVEGLLESDIEFLSRNLGNIEDEAESRKTIENLPGEGANTISLVDEFDLSTSLNKFTDNQTAKCITVASTTSGMFHSVPVAHISAPRLSSTVHYYRGTTGQARTVHHLPATVTIQNIPGTTSQMIRGIPINSKSGTFSTVMSQGAAGIVNIGGRTTSAALGGPSTQYVNVSAKSFPSGNILHNAIVTRNIINRTNMPTTSGMTYVTAVTPASSTALKISPTVTKSSTDYDTISTTKDMIDNACNSLLMLKKVLTLGSSSATKSFMMHNTQKVLSTGFANGITPPPNVTIVSSGTAGVNLVSNDMGNNNSSIVSTQPASTLSASHATLSALLASNAENVQTTKN